MRMLKYEVCEEKLIFNVTEQATVRHEIFPYEKREQRLIEYLQKLESPVYGFLHYVDKTTMNYLRHVRDDVEIHLVVGRIIGKSKIEEENIEAFKKICNDFKDKRKGEFEVFLLQSEIWKQCPKAWMHDRFLSSGNFHLAMGGDLTRSFLLSPGSFTIIATPVNQWEEYDDFVDYFRSLLTKTDQELRARGIVFQRRERIV